MKRREFLLDSALAAVAFSTFLPVASAAGKTKKILYFERTTGFIHPPTIYEADGVSAAGKRLKKLGEKFNCEVVCSKDGSIFDGDLDQYDAFIFYTCGNLDKPGGPDKQWPCMSDAGRDKFFAAIQNGKGFLGIHSATDTWKSGGPRFENQPEDKRTKYIDMIGGEFIVHGAQQETTLTVVDSSLPWLAKQGKSFKFFDEWYTLKNFNKDIHVLLVQETKGMRTDKNNKCYDRPAYPSTWVRMYGKGRVAYTSLGHNTAAWSEEVVPSVVSDLMGFILGAYNVDMTPNMDKVCPGATTLLNSKE